MKRTLLAVALVVLGAEVAGLLWSQRKAAQLSAAQLAPPETVFLAECPNLPAAVLRWKGTALHDILAEPEVRAFLSRPATAGVQELAADWMRVQPRQAFLAVTSIADAMPQAVAGLAFDGDRRELEPLIARAMIQAQNASPRGSMARLHYRGFSIITFKDRGITVAGCFARDWYFAANDVELLKGTLDRLLGKTQTVLALTSKYQASQAALPAQADFRLFLQSSSVSNRLLTRSNGQPAALALPHIQFETAALACRFEGRLLHDTLLLSQRAGPTPPALNGRTLALTSSDTVFYGALAPRLESWFTSSGGRGGQPGKLIPTLLAALTAPGSPTRLANFQAAFGPEHALILDWPRSSSQPDFFLASEVRDAAQARRFTEALFRTWDRMDDGSVPIWALSPARPALFHPAVALAGSHLVAGLSSESLRPFALHAAAPHQPGATLERSPLFQTSLILLAKPQTGLAYLDAAAFFERLHTALAPAILLWAPSVPWLGRYADFSRFPPAQPVTRHLSPISLTAHHCEGGSLIDTAGPVSFVEIGAGLGAAAFYALLPSLHTTPPTTPGIVPPPLLKPLSHPLPGP